MDMRETLDVLLAGDQKNLRHSDVEIHRHSRARFHMDTASGDLAVGTAARGLVGSTKAN